MNDEADTKLNASEEEIRLQLGRMLQSSTFLHSERLARFLRYTIESVLNQELEVLKEYVIGTQVYDRKPPYDPKQDSIVRSEARRLRAKLKLYYETDGKADPILIYFRPGSYVPIIRRQDQNDFGGSEFFPNPDLLTPGPGEAIAALPFKDLSGTSTSSLFARILTDEWMHGLMRAKGIRVTAVSLTECEQRDCDLSAIAQRLGVHLFLRGTVREHGPWLRVTVQSVKPDGFQIWSNQFEVQPGDNDISFVSEHITRSLNDNFSPKSSAVRKMRASFGPAMLDKLPMLFRSEALLDEGTCTDVEIQIANLERFARDTPGFPDPICGIAECWYELALRGAAVSSAAIAAAKLKALEASKLDGEMGYPIGCAAALLGLEWDWAAAEEAFQKAFRLDPGAATYRQAAMLFAARGRFDKAQYYLEKAQHLNPFAHRQKIAWARFFILSRNYKALDHHVSQRTLFGPVPLEARLYRALAYAMQARCGEAMKVLEENGTCAVASPIFAGLLAETAALCGETAFSQEIITCFQLLSPSTGISRFRQCLLALALDDTAAAFSLLTAAVERRDPEAIWLSVEPRLDKLRGLPGFAELAGQVTGSNSRTECLSSPLPHPYLTPAH